MGANFFQNHEHIGKRSAAGLYCWNCNQTLSRGHVHDSNSEWFKSCPRCGSKPKKEKLENNSVGRELGFNKGKFKKKKGVASCSSFTWAIHPYDLTDDPVMDEYKKEYRREDFDRILDECPIQFFGSIDTDFC